MLMKTRRVSFLDISGTAHHQNIRITAVFEGWRPVEYDTAFVCARARERDRERETERERGMLAGAVKGLRK